MTNIHEILRDIDAQSDKILLTVKSSRQVYDKLKSLYDSVSDVAAFFEKVKNTKVMFLAKGKLKREMIRHYQALKAKCTDMMSAVSLELLTNQSLHPPPPAPIIIERAAPAPAAPVVIEKPVEPLEERYLKGCKWYYGIERPKNFNRAYEHFIYCAEHDHLASVTMVALMHKHGYGTELSDRDCVEWLKRGIALGSASAKYLLAVGLVTKLAKGINQTEEFSMQPETEQFRQVLSTLDVAAAFEHSDEVENEESATDQSDNAKRFRVVQKAMQLLLSAASDNYADAQTELGQAFEVAGDLEEAVAWYEGAARSGCMRATNLLAMLYFTGRGVTTKLESAHDMFKEAAVGGNGHAYNNIALCMERGYGTDVDIEGAYHMYLRGALLGSPESMYSLGFLSIKRVMDSETALTAGDIRHLPEGKREGGLEMAQSTAEAVQLVRYVTLESHNGGSSSRRPISGGRAAAGDGADHSGCNHRDALLRSGVRWMRRAAEMAVAEAGYQLGLLYEQGTGLPRDATAAYEQYLWAAERGNHRAALHAARMLYDEAKALEEHATGSPGEMEKCRDRYNAAAVLYRYAAEFGVPEAMNALGLMLEDGSAKIDGTPDDAEAARWYLAAAGAGSVEAAGNLALLLAAKGGRFDFGVETPTGYRATPSELEAWLDSLAQRAAGNPRAQWLRDAVSRLTGRTLQRQYEAHVGAAVTASKSGNTHPERQLPRMMMNSGSTFRRSSVATEPVFNELPIFTKRQRNYTDGAAIGTDSHHVPQLRTSEIELDPLRGHDENNSVNRTPVPELAPHAAVQPVKTPSRHVEPVFSSANGKQAAARPTDGINSSPRTQFKESVQVDESSNFDNDPAPQVSDPSSRWGKVKRSVT